MRILTLFLVLLGTLACAGGGDEAPPVVENVPPATTSDETAPAIPPAEEDTTLSVVGGSRIGKYVSDDWVRVNNLTQQFYDGELETVYSKFTDEMKVEWPLDKLRAFRTRVLEENGDEVDVVGSTKEEKNGYRAYKRAARFSKSERLVEVAWVLDADDRVAGLFVTPDRSAN